MNGIPNYGSEMSAVGEDVINTNHKIAVEDASILASENYLWAWKNREKSERYLLIFITVKPQKILRYDK